jgi:hypothetical protein
MQNRLALFFNCLPAFRLCLQFTQSMTIKNHYSWSESTENKVFIQILLTLFSTLLVLHRTDTVFTGKIPALAVGLVFVFSWLETLRIYSLKQPVFLLFGLLLGFGWVNFPLTNGNPFYAFSLFKIQYFFQLGLAFASWYIAYREHSEKRLVRWVFGLPIGFLVLVNVFYVAFNFGEVDPFDGSRHVSNAMSLYDLLVSHEPGKIYKAITFYDFYLPVSYLSAFPFLVLFGKSFTGAVFSLVLFWMPLGYVMIWKTLRRSFNSSALVAALVAFLLLACGMSASMVKLYWQDYQLFVLGLFFQYAFLKTDFLKNQKQSIWLGVLFGFGLLLKANFFLFGVVPAAFVVFLGISNKDLEQRMTNLFFFLVISIAMASIWFTVNIYFMDYEMITGAKEYGEKNFPEVLSAASLGWYFPRLIDSLGIFQSVLLAIGILASIVSAMFRKKEYLYFLLVFLFYFSLIHLFRVKDQRTLFPALGLLIPFFAAAFQNKFVWVSRVAMILALVFIIQETTYLATDKTFLIPKVAMNGGFTIHRGAQLPYVDAPNQAYFSWVHLAKRNGFNPEKWPLQFENEFTLYAQRYYQLKLRNEDGKAIDPLTHNRIPIFCRDTWWQDYYLFSGQKSDSVFRVFFEEQLAEIDGDVVLDIGYFDSAGTVLKFESRRIVKALGEVASYPIPQGSANIHLKFKLFHSFGTGQRVRALYQWAENTDYPIFDIPLLVYKTDGKRSDEIIIPL